MTGSRICTFGDWMLDTASGELRRGDTVLRLQEQPLRILQALLERPGDVVTREELIARLWPQGVVEYDMGLNTAVRKLRLALDDDAETPRYIETLPRRGYRYIGPAATGEGAVPAIAPVDTPAIPSPEQPDAAGDSAGPPRSRRTLPWAVIGGLLLVALGLVWLWEEEPPGQPNATTSLAVLPFRPLVQDAHDPAMALGVAGALITRLSSVPQVRVAPLGSVRRFTADSDPLQAARELGVEVVLEGHLQQQDQRLRVSARLLRVADGASLWSGQFDEVVDDLFLMQDLISDRVVAAIAPELGGRRFADWPAETSSLEAFRQFAAAQYNQFRRDTNGVPAAIAHYEAALAADPRYADAWAGLSVALMVEVVFGMQPPTAAFARAREAAQRALEIKPQSPAALGAMGHVLIQADRRYAEGLEYYRRALAINQDQALVHQWVAIAQAHAGNLTVALEHIRRAQALEPRTLAFASNAGMLLYFARRHDEAIRELEALLVLEPRLDQALSALGNARLAKGDASGALTAFRGRSTPGPGGLGDIGRAQAVAGDRAAATVELAQLRRLAAQGFGVAHDEATIYSLLGDKEAACRSLEQALTDGSPMLGFMRVDPRLDGIRGEPCFARVERALYDI